MIELSNEEKTAFIHLCASAQEIETAAEFQNWMRMHVNAFFPFGMMAAVRGSILDDIIFVEQLISVDDPDESLRHLQMQTKLSDRPVVAKWHREREPQMIHDAPMAQLIPHLACARENKYSLQNLAVHGQIDKQGHKGTYYLTLRTRLHGNCPRHTEVRRYGNGQGAIGAVYGLSDKQLRPGDGDRVVRIAGWANQP